MKGIIRVSCLLWMSVAIALASSSEAFPYVQQLVDGSRGNGKQSLVERRRSDRAASLDLNAAAANLETKATSLNQSPSSSVLAPPQEIRSQNQDLKTSEQRVQNALVTGVCFMAGVANVLSFKTFGFYASMMTGNNIRLCMAMADGRLSDSLFYALAIVGYTSGSTLYAWVQQKLQASSSSPRTKFHTMARVTLISFVVTDVLRHVGQAFLPRDRLLCLLPFGFGIVNALCVQETSVVSFAATGHIHKVSAGIAAWLANPSRPRGPAAKASLKVIRTFLSSLLLTAAVWRKASPEVLALFHKCAGTFFGIIYAVLFAWCGAQFSGNVPNPELISARQEEEGAEHGSSIIEHSQEGAPQDSSNTSWEALWWFSPFQNKGNDNNCTE